jgi:hypothetical protein
VCLKTLDLSAWVAQLRGRPTLESIAQKNSQFTHLIIKGPNPDVTDAFIAQLASVWHPRGVAVQVVDLSRCASLTDVAVRAITQVWSLRGLDLTGCPLITDKTLQLLARHCPGLHSLVLHGCDQITSAALAAMVPKCKHIRELDIEGCTKITDRALRTIG